MLNDLVDFSATQPKPELGTGNTGVAKEPVLVDISNKKDVHDSATLDKKELDIDKLLTKDTEPNIVKQMKPDVATSGAAVNDGTGSGPNIEPSAKPVVHTDIEPIVIPKRTSVSPPKTRCRKFEALAIKNINFATVSHSEGHY